MRSAQSRREPNHAPRKKRSKDVGEAQQTRSSEQRVGLIREAKGKTAEAANVPVWLVQRSKRRIQKRGFKRARNEAVNSNGETDERRKQPPSGKKEEKKDACPEMGLSHSLLASAS